MTTPDVEPVRDPTLRITVEHSSYYRMMPVPEENVFDDTPGEDGSSPECPQDKVPLSKTADFTIPGFRLYRAVVNEPTHTTTDVHLPDLRLWRDEMIAAGKGHRSLKSILIEHLEDGPWDKHFPLDSATAIYADDVKWQGWLQDYFLAADDDDYLGGDA